MTDPACSRLELLVGPEGLARLRAASVAVFGLGGVGSFAVEALARGGIGRLTLIDFDNVAASNLNRQLHALQRTLGRPKAEVLAERCREINPQIAVEAIHRCYDADTSDELLAGDYDFVLDCIDQVTAKLHLIESCHHRNIPFIASMGAANKIDPGQVRYSDLFATQKCRLARIVRKELRRRGITSGVNVVYSTEEFRPLAAGRRCEESGGTHYQERRAPLGSSSVIPPLFGLTMAGEAIRSLLGE